MSVLNEHMQVELPTMGDWYDIRIVAGSNFATLMDEYTCSHYSNADVCKIMTEQLSKRTLPDKNSGKNEIITQFVINWVDVQYKNAQIHVRRGRARATPDKRFFTIHVYVNCLSFIEIRFVCRY